MFALHQTLAFACLPPACLRSATCLPLPPLSFPAGESVVGKEELKAKKAAEKRKAPKAAKLLAAKGKLQKTAGG